MRISDWSSDVCSSELKGVVIAAVNASSDAAQKGLQRGDIILSVNQQPVTTPQEAAKAVAATRQAGRDSVLLLVQRGPTPGRYVGVQLSKDRKSTRLNSSH